MKCLLFKPANLRNFKTVVLFLEKLKEETAFVTFCKSKVKCDTKRQLSKLYYYYF